MGGGHRRVGVLADKAYISSANRGYLAGRGIKITIPERSDQIAGRARRGSKAASTGSSNGVASRPEATKQRAATSPASTLASALIWIKSAV